MTSQKEKSKLHPVAKFLAVSTTITQIGLISKKKILKNNKKNKEKPSEEAKINLKEFLTHQLDFTDEQKMSAKYFELGIGCRLPTSSFNHYTFNQYAKTSLYRVLIRHIFTLLFYSALQYENGAVIFNLQNYCERVSTRLYEQP